MHYVQNVPYKRCIYKGVSVTFHDIGYIYVPHTHIYIYIYIVL